MYPEANTLPKQPCPAVPIGTSSAAGLVDFHVHVTPPETAKNWQKYADNEPYFKTLSENPQNKFASALDVITELDSSGFDKAVIFGFAFRDMGLCRYVNDYVIEQVKLYPEKLIGFMSVQPACAGLEKEIDRCQSAGLVGIGELFPEGQGFDAGDAPQAAALANICTERGLPVLLHVNEPVGHGYPGKTNTSLRQIERFIENSPGLKIVLAHWGGGLLFYEAMPEMRKKCRNVYYDTAATPFLYQPEIYRAACALGLAEKIIFGSDFPLLSPSRYMAGINASGISACERELILGGNAERILML
jgi:predicted TIM-barrel fold metal-dependent hydrolase